MNTLIRFTKIFLVGFACIVQPGAQAAPGKAQVKPARTEGECLSQWQGKMSDPRPDSKGGGLPPDQMCMNNIRLPANQGTCVKIYQEVIDAYTKCEESVKPVCALVPEAYAAKCNNQGVCQNATAEFRSKYANALVTHNNNVKALIGKMKEMSDLGINISEQYAHDLNELKLSPDKTINTQVSERQGGKTIEEALRNHANQDTSQILSIIAKARQSSTISQSEIDGTIKSPYVFEQLQATAVALDQKHELEAYSKSLTAQQSQVEQAAKVGSERGSSMDSLGSSGSNLSGSDGLPSLPSSEGGAAASGLTKSGFATAPTPSGAEAAAYGAGNASATADQPAFNAGNRSSARNRIKSMGSNSLETAGTPSLAGASSQAQGEPVLPAGSGAATAGTETNRSGASSPSGSLRDALQARLVKQRAAREAGANGGVEGSQIATAGSGSLARANASGRARGNGENGGIANSGERMAPFAMANSETEGVVRGMVREFERDLGTAAGRSPATINEEAASQEILPSESSSLFSRLKEVHARCLKRGCVITHASQKGKI